MARKTFTLLLVGGILLTAFILRSPTPTPTPDVSEKMVTDEGYRKDYAARGLRPYMRDPDSLVVESASLAIRCTLDYRPVELYKVQYRARNGFGGYNRDSAWIVYDIVADQVNVWDHKPPTTR